MPEETPWLGETPGSSLAPPPPGASRPLPARRQQTGFGSSSPACHTPVPLEQPSGRRPCCGSPCPLCGWFAPPRSTDLLGRGGSQARPAPPSLPSHAPGPARSESQETPSGRSDQGSPRCGKRWWGSRSGGVTARPQARAAAHQSGPAPAPCRPAGSASGWPFPWM